MLLSDSPTIPLTALIGASRSTPGPDFGQHTVFFENGRQALACALASIPRIGKIWLPAFLCRSIIPGIDRPIEFYDVDQQLQPRIDKGVISAGDVVLGVRYFGIKVEISALKNSDSILIEDCAHGLPLFGSTDSLGNEGQMAIFSLRKLLPVPDGGVLIGARTANAAPAVRFNPFPPRTLRLLLEQSARRLGLNVLPWKDIFRTTHLPVDGNPSPLGPASATLRILSSLNFEEIANKRRSNYLQLAHNLRVLPGVEIPYSDLPPGSVPQVLPLKVARPNELCRLLRSKGIPATRWPGNESLELDYSIFPGASDWLTRGLTLPVHQDLTSNEIDAIAPAVAEALC